MRIAKRSVALRRSATHAAQRQRLVRARRWQQQAVSSRQRRDEEQSDLPQALVGFDSSRARA